MGCQSSLKDEGFRNVIMKICRSYLFISVQQSLTYVCLKILHEIYQLHSGWRKLLEIVNN